MFKEVVSLVTDTEGTALERNVGFGNASCVCCCGRVEDLGTKGMELPFCKNAETEASEARRIGKEFQIEDILITIKC
jgi:hypothetical protein